MILGTALSPLLFGVLIDNDYNFSHIIIFGLIIVVLVSVLSTQVSISERTSSKPVLENIN